MKLRLSILLLAAALAASPAAGQTIKSLGYNTTNGNIVAATNVTFTNSVGFATNARAATRTNLGLGWSALTNTNTANALIGYDTANNAVVQPSISTASFDFGASGIRANNAEFGSASGSVGFSTNGRLIFYTTNSGLTFAAGASGAQLRSDLGLGATWLTNTDVTNFRTAIGLGATNNVTFSNITATGTLGVSNTATFATNVTVNGNLSVGSLTTTTPSTWALDATQTAAATNGILALPSNANVIRLTNSTAISGVSGGVLGAFYYLVNQATNAVTISNVGGITIDGAQNLTLSPNESATLVATGATNASVAARGDLTDVTLGGTLNIAPAQTANSADSLMTRGLSDDRYRLFYVPLVHVLSQTAASGSTWNLRPFHSADAVFSVPPWARNVRINLSTGFTNAPVTNNFTAVITAYPLTASNSFGIPYAQTTNALSVTQVWSNGSNSYRFILRMTNDLALTSSGISDAESAGFWNILIQLRNDSSGSLTTVPDNWLRGMAVFTD